MLIQRTARSVNTSGDTALIKLLLNFKINQTNFDTAGFEMLWDKENDIKNNIVM